MQQMPNSKAKDFVGSDSGPRRPDVVLLSKRQWHYVQNHYGLTPRERQIAELICQGHRNGRIAKALRIKPGTVKTHTRNIYRKVHVESKIAMLLRFLTAARDLASAYESATRTPSVAD